LVQGFAYEPVVYRLKIDPDVEKVELSIAVAGLATGPV
jgi:hypothetical protein